MIVAFSEILFDDFYKLENILSDNKNYFAHRKDNPLQRELLSTHTDLTLRYFQKLVSINGLDKIVDFQITEFVKAEGFDDNSIFVFIKKSFINTVYFHDFGKINENFQIHKMLNDSFQEKRNGIQTKHSILSSLLFLSYQIHQIYQSNFNDKEKILLYYLNILFVQSISQHHGQLNNPDVFQFDIVKQKTLVDYVCKFKPFAKVDIELFWRLIGNNYDKILSISKSIKNSFLPFSLVKLNSSLLTAADYYATNEFMSGIKVNDFGTLNKKLNDKIIKNVKAISYNNDLYNKYDFYNSISIKKLEGKNNKNLNLLRQSLSANVIDEIRKSFKNKLFYLEAPTGSGKTNLSLLLLSELLLRRKDISKIFYVFPFTTLITQTFDSIKSNLQLCEKDIVEIHSKASFNRTNDDSNYGSDKLNYIDSLFINFPISLVSHVTFFDILTSTKKEKTYLLHRLSNSIVIIDEIQSYAPSEWDKINYLIKQFSAFYNITFLIMSATLPQISKLLIKGKADDPFVYLNKKRDEYFKNPNFSERVEIDLSLFEKTFSEVMLLEKVIETSEKYFQKNNSVKTIIEFIAKKRAYEFYNSLTSSKLFSAYQIFLISGTILEPRRREIIEYLKKKNDTEKTIVISTQVIEAGVDIDMDIGFKDKSIIDSEEQIAGRINRNAKKSGAKLYIFSTGDASKIYRNDLRYQLHLSTQQYFEILSKKDFDLYYQLVFEQINRDNSNEYLAGQLSEFISFIAASNFKSVSNSFQLIKNNSISIFVPLKINLKYFSTDEIIFLKNFTFPFADNFIDGFKVWNIYEKIIKNKIDDFILQKINLKIMSSIISKFTFSIWKNPYEYNVLRHYALDGEEKYGFLMLNDYEDIYSYEAGLVSKIDENVNFIGF